MAVFIRNTFAIKVDTLICISIRQHHQQQTKLLRLFFVFNITSCTNVYTVGTFVPISPYLSKLHYTESKSCKAILALHCFPNSFNKFNYTHLKSSNSNYLTTMQREFQILSEHQWPFLMTGSLTTGMYVDECLDQKHMVHYLFSRPLYTKT